MERQHIIGLEQFGQRLMLAVQHYVRDTNQPHREDVIKNIYFQAVSQVLAKMTPNIQEFAYAMYEVPSWKTIDYTGEVCNTPAHKTFADAVRSFGQTLQARLVLKGILVPGMVFYLESCTELVAVVRLYEDRSLDITPHQR